VSVERTENKKADQSKFVLHAGAEKKIRETLKGAIKMCPMVGVYPDFRSETLWAWKFSDTCEKYLGIYLSAGNAWSILVDQIVDYFKNRKTKSEVEGLIQDLLSEKELQELEDKVIGFIRSIPREYVIYLKLYRSKNYDLGRVKIANGVEMFQVSENDSLLQLKPVWIDGLFESSSNTFRKDDVVLKINSTGFIRDDVNDSGVAAALSKIKFILYFGTLFGVFKHKRAWSIYAKQPLSALYTVDTISNDGTISKVDFFHDIAQHVSGYFASGNEDGNDIYKRIEKLQLIGRFFDFNPIDKNVSSLVAAVEWAFDSYANTNETVSFIQLCIAMEVLLGDEIGNRELTKTLADRGAYINGKTQEARVLIRDEFMRLYKIRSKLVHGRKSSLDKDATQSFEWGKIFLNSILKKEFRNLVTVLAPAENL